MHYNGCNLLDQTYSLKLQFIEPSSIKIGFNDPCSSKIWFIKIASSGIWFIKIGSSKIWFIEIGSLEIVFRARSIYPQIILRLAGAGALCCACHPKMVYLDRCISLQICLSESHFSFPVCASKAFTSILYVLVPRTTSVRGRVLTKLTRIPPKLQNVWVKRKFLMSQMFLPMVLPLLLLLLLPMLVLLLLLLLLLLPFVDACGLEASPCSTPWRSTESTADLRQDCNADWNVCSDTTIGEQGCTRIFWSSRYTVSWEMRVHHNGCNLLEDLFIKISFY